MSENDWKMLEMRRSCALLTRDEMQHGKVPTTPTTASVIAGIQCQEAVKLLHGLETIKGGGFIFEGTRHQSYPVVYTRKEDCPAHDRYEPIEELDWKSESTRVGDLLERVRRDVGPEAVIEFNQDLLASLQCEKCRVDTPLRTSLGKVTEKQGRCPRCGEHRVPRTYHSIDGGEESRGLLDLTLASIGVPAWDILAGRAGFDGRYYELAGDRAAVLGGLA